VERCHNSRTDPFITLPIRYFIDDFGRRVAENNRGLAALTMAGMEPTITIEVERTSELAERLWEKPIDRFHPVVGTRIAVTIQRDGTGHLYTVFMPY